MKLWVIAVVVLSRLIIFSKLPEFFNHWISLSLVCFIFKSNSVASNSWPRLNYGRKLLRAGMLHSSSFRPIKLCKHRIIICSLLKLSSKWVKVIIFWDEVLKGFLTHFLKFRDLDLIREELVSNSRVQLHPRYIHSSYGGRPLQNIVGDPS
jgi:hypothetical protein